MSVMDDAGVGRQVPTLPDLAAQSRHHARLARETLLAVVPAEEAIRATLTDEQAALFDAYEDAMARHQTETIDLYVAEFQRHAPGLAPAILAVFQHIVGPDGQPGACCQPSVGR